MANDLGTSASGADDSGKKRKRELGSGSTGRKNKVGGGRPKADPEGKELHSSGVSFTERQIDWLWDTTHAIRKRCRKTLANTQIVRAMIDAFIDAKVDLTVAENEDDIRRILKAKFK